MDLGLPPAQIETGLIKSFVGNAKACGKKVQRKDNATGLDGVPTLRQIQQKVYEMKKAKTAGYCVGTLNELKTFVMALNIPCASNVVNDELKFAMLTVPITTATLESAGVPLCSPHQAKLISQLADMPDRFTLHADGKYKLHHGGFILLTLGTHVLKLVKQQLRTSFVPLMHVVKPAGESEAGCTLLLESANFISMMLNGKSLSPSYTCNDHCDSYKNAFTRTYPNAYNGQCYPHIIVRLTRGEFIKKTHPNFEDAYKHIRSIHLASSECMKLLLIAECGKVWDTWAGRPMHGFWDEYCVAPWDCWSIGSTNAMLATPSNQTIESWHKTLLHSCIPGLFKCSTEALLTVSIPQLLQMDDVKSPSHISFHLPGIPNAMLEKALLYVQQESARIITEKERDRKTIHTWYFLSFTSNCKKATSHMLEQFRDAYFSGVMPRRCKTLDDLIDVCANFHVVRYALTENVDIATCEGNPAELFCDCKGFRHVGICSHVLAANHLLHRFNLRHALKSFGRGKKKKNQGGFVKGVRPALCREDSSDEETDIDEDAAQSSTALLTQATISK